jgi:hypothetical protein
MESFEGKVKLGDSIITLSVANCWIAKGQKMGTFKSTNWWCEDDVYIKDIWGKFQREYEAVPF